jgi:hypothetical protein
MALAQNFKIMFDKFNTDWYAFKKYLNIKLLPNRKYIESQL